MATFLITGANRGLGLEFARQLAGKNHTVIGTARDPAKAQDLARLAHQVIALDTGDAASIKGIRDQLKGRPIDVLINNAGMSSNSKSVRTLDAAELDTVFRVNALGPILVAQAVLDNLKAGQRKLIMSITSQLGSIANNNGGSSYGYRGSKAALNMLSVCLSNELKGDGFTVIVAHPGWVKTDMGGPGAPLEAKDSVRDLLAIVDRVTPADSGKFFNHDGGVLPW